MKNFIVVIFCVICMLPSEDVHAQRRHRNPRNHAWLLGRTRIDKDQKQDSIYVNGKFTKKRSLGYKLTDKLTNQIRVHRHGYHSQYIAIQYDSTMFRFYGYPPLIKLPKKKNNELHLAVKSIGCDLLKSSKEKRVDTEKDSVYEKIKNIEFNKMPSNLNQFLLQQNYFDKKSACFYAEGSIRSMRYKYQKCSHSSESIYYHTRPNYDTAYIVSIDKTLVSWKIYNPNNVLITEIDTEISSGDFTDKKEEKAIFKAINYALEVGLIKLLNSTIYKKLSKEQLAFKYEDITIPKTSYVSNLQEAVNACVTIKLNTGHGSGFAISNNGYILTNYHVIKGGYDIKVITADGQTHSAKVKRVDENHDIALLKIDVTDMMSLELDLSEEVEIGADIYAIGTPSAEDLSQTLSKGIISGLPTIREMDYIQTDASVNAGNSGGALLTQQNKAMAMVTAKLVGIGIEGIAFGIPSRDIVKILQDLHITFK